MPSIGKVLRDARLEAGLSQGVVAKRAGMGANHLSQVELGRSASPEFNTVARIAAALHLSLDEVAARSGAPGFRKVTKLNKTTEEAVLRAFDDLAKIERSAQAAALGASELSLRLARGLPPPPQPRRRSRK